MQWVGNGRNESGAADVGPLVGMASDMAASDPISAGACRAEAISRRRTEIVACS